VATIVLDEPVGEVMTRRSSVAGRTILSPHHGTDDHWQIPAIWPVVEGELGSGLTLDPSELSCRLRFGQNYLRTSRQRCAIYQDGRHQDGPDRQRPN